MAKIYPFPSAATAGTSTKATNTLSDSHQVTEIGQRRRWRWNWRRAWDNLLTLVGMIAVGAWLGWMLLVPWLVGW